MTIEEIDVDEELRKKNEENEKEKLEKGRYIKLIKEFNKEAEKISCPFRIRFKSYGGFPSLFRVKKWWIFDIGDEYNTIFHFENHHGNKKNIFTFSEGLDYKIFKAIEPILNEINSKFYIKLKNGEVPTKYKILENL